MNRINDPKYCKYHHIVGHHVGKCFILKELIMKLAQQGRIELDLEDTAATHATTVVFESFDPVLLQEMPDHARQYSNHTAHSAPPSLGASNQDAPTDDDKGWTLVTYKRTRKPKPQAIKPKGKQGRKHRRRGNRKPKRNIRAAKPIYDGEPAEQKPRIPVSLHEYFPEDFFQHCTITACHMVEVEMEEPSKGKIVAAEGENTLTPEEGLPIHFSIEEALQLPKKIRSARKQERRLEASATRVCHMLCRLGHNPLRRRILVARIQASQPTSLRLWVRKGAQSQPHACGRRVSHKYHAKVNNDRNRHQGE
ncbi:hypothetical protein ACFX2B_040177 [Malus domestica]